MNRGYIFIILNLFIAKYSFASYVKTNIPTLIEKSNVIVYGKIISFQEKTFKVLTLSAIKGSKKSDTLTIQKFINWACATRYSGYVVGQEAIFFIQKNKEKKYFVMGSGNEGELIVKNGMGYVRDFNQNKFETKKIVFISKYDKFIELPLKTIMDGIKIYLDNYEDINKELGNGSEGVILYQYGYIDKLPKNDFLAIAIEQKRDSIIRG